MKHPTNEQVSYWEAMLAGYGLSEQQIADKDYREKRSLRGLVARRIAAGNRGDGNSHTPRTPSLSELDSDIVRFIKQ